MNDSKFEPRQGDIIKIDSEYFGLVINHPYLSKTSPLIWVVPISEIEYDYPSHIKLKNNDINGTIYIEQIHSIDYENRQIELFSSISNDILITVLETAKELLIRNIDEEKQNKKAA